MYIYTTVINRLTKDKVIEILGRDDSHENGASIEEN